MGKKFNFLNPKKGIGGRRYYSPQEINNLKQIKKLLYDDGFTINGAKMYLDNKKHNSKKDLTYSDLSNEFNELYSTLNKIKSILIKY